MAVETHIGGNSLAAANWSGSGFADDATLVIGEGSQNITADLDRRADTTDTTGGIGYLIVEGDYSGTIATAAGPAQIEFDADYASGPSFVMNSRGAVCYIEFSTNTCPKMWVLLGTVEMTGGTVTEVHVSGGKFVQHGGTVTTLYQYGGFVDQKAAASASTTIRQEGGQLISEIAPTTFEQEPGGVATFRSETGDFTTAKINGRTNLLAGSVPTLDGRSRGVLDVSRAIEPVTIGGTAYTRRGGFTIIGEDGSLITVSNESAEAAGGSAGGVGIGGTGL